MIYEEEKISFLLGSGQNPHFPSLSYRLVVAHHSDLSSRPSWVHSWCHWWLNWKGNMQGVPWAFPLRVYRSKRRKGQSQIHIMSAWSLETVIESMHFFSYWKPTMSKALVEPLCLVNVKVQDLVLGSENMLINAVFIYLSTCLFTMVHCYSSTHICERMKRKI